ncbi:hypothetical protein E3U55_14980 [Filobacillus milosensis]|uniref:PepSY domain-containing protein n=1 Tax=Filobacillus milosensis TaxID=94137 RepID=A0A4Y8IGC4_9BACI|nr:PepSY domain-containing protein [Filobacillus milosensis]TFB14081.1 hypothetical protein E3U55_14980 [Filobacillus milosensis]
MIKERILWMLGGAIITVVVFVLAQQFVFGTSSAENITKEEAEDIVLKRFSGDIDQIEEEKQHYSVIVNTDSRSYKVMVDKQNGDLYDYELIENKKDNNPESEDDSTNGNQDSNEQNDPAKQTKDQSSDEKEDSEQKQEEALSLLKEAEITEQVQEVFDGEIGNIELNETDHPFYKIEIEKDLEIITLKVDAYKGDILSEESQPKDKNTPISKEEAIKKASSVIEGKLDDVELKNIKGTLYYFIELELPSNQDVTIRINAINGSTTTIWDQKDDDKNNEEGN